MEIKGKVALRDKQAFAVTLITPLYTVKLVS